MIHALRARLQLVLLAVPLLACIAPPVAEAPPVARPSAETAFGPALDAAPSEPALLVLVTVSGLGPAEYQGPDPAMPTLAAWGKLGIQADAVVPVSPAGVYPAHATLMTGAAPSAHGVDADRVLTSEGITGEQYRHVDQLAMPTLWQRLQEAETPVAVLDWPGSQGASVPLLLPDVEPGTLWLTGLDSHATPAIAQAARGRAKPGIDRPGAVRDTFLVDVACALAAGATPPRVILLRLAGAEDALIGRGPGSDVARAAFGQVDAELARLADCVAANGRARGASFVVTGDAVPSPIHTAIRGNVLLAQAGLLDLDPRGGVTAWRAILRSNGRSAFLYAIDAESALAARNVLLAEAERSGSFELVRASELIELAAGRNAWFALVAAPGRAFVDASSGPLLSPAAFRGAAGDLGSAAPPVGFVAIGRGLRRALRVPVLAQGDIAPTLARLLGVELAVAPDAEHPSGLGRAQVGLLRLPGDVAAPPPYAIDPALVPGATAP